MQQKEIIEKLTLIFRNIFKDATLEIELEMTVKDIDNWDSLSNMLMINDVETMFGIKFKIKDLNKIKRVGDLVAIIESKLQ